MRKTEVFIGVANCKISYNNCVSKGTLENYDDL